MNEPKPGRLPWPRLITAEEMLVAARRALEYPPGKGHVWGVGTLETTRIGVAANLIDGVPRLAATCGCPAVALALHRSRLDRWGLEEAFDALSEVFDQRAGLRFSAVLGDDPVLAAGLLFEWAEERSAL